MIIISHQQARRLVREMLDRPLPEGSWSALQAHLEICGECRAYHQQRARLERRLRRALASGWSSVDQPSSGLASALSQRLQLRTRRAALFHRALGYAALVGLVGLALLLYSAFGRSAPAAAVPSPQAEPLAAQAPTEAPVEELRRRAGSEFVGTLVFDALIWGAPDILMLTTGPYGQQTENLTNNPAADTSPSWSPDGEWIAFLSNRDRPDKGMDIYLISVASTRLTRLTADPRLSWSAPLSWSPDGRWIAARASASPAPKETDTGENHWIYRVGVNGGAPQPLPFSRGAHTPRFAPNQPLLAYIAEEGQLSFLRVYDARAGVTHDLTRSEAAASGMGAGGRDGPGSTSVRAFDWAADGSGILYILNRSEPERDPYWVQVRWAPTPPRVPVTGKEALTAMSAATQEVYTVPSISPIVTAGLSGGGDLFYTRTYRRDGSWTSCRMLQSLDGPGEETARPLALPVLCFDSLIERAAWTSDGRTLAAIAHSTTEDDPGIYAITLQDAGNLGRIVRTERLADLPEGAGQMRVRPRIASRSARKSPLEPVQALNPGASGPVVPPPELLDRVLASGPHSAGFTISRLSDDGARTEILPGGRHGSCPARSPDGDLVTYLAWSPGEELPSYNIFLMDAHGRNEASITAHLEFDDPEENRPVVAVFGCPVWSPDGSRLAAWAKAGTASSLVILTVRGEGDPLVLPLTPSGSRTPPAWTQDGEDVIVFLKSEENGGSDMALVDAARGTVTPLLTGSGWETVATAAGAGGGRVAYTALSFSSGPELLAGVRITGEAEGQEGAWVNLPPFALFTGVEGYDYMAWLPGDGAADAPRLGLVFRGSSDGRSPSALMLYDLESARLTTLAVIHEAVQAAAWSPDGRWVIYTTPTGLWSLAVPVSGEAPAALPFWLSKLRADWLDWR